MEAKPPFLGKEDDCSCPIGGLICKHSLYLLTNEDHEVLQLNLVVVNLPVAGDDGDGNGETHHGCLTMLNCLTMFTELGGSFSV